jgi:hypothetical protein
MTSPLLTALLFAAFSSPARAQAPAQMDGYYMLADSVGGMPDGGWPQVDSGLFSSEPKDNVKFVCGVAPVADKMFLQPTQGHLNDYLALLWRVQVAGGNRIKGLNAIFTASCLRRRNGAFVSKTPTPYMSVKDHAVFPEAIIDDATKRLLTSGQAPMVAAGLKAAMGFRAVNFEDTLITLAQSPSGAPLDEILRAIGEIGRDKSADFLFGLWTGGISDPKSRCVALAAFTQVILYHPSAKQQYLPSLGGRGGPLMALAADNAPAIKTLSAAAQESYCIFNPRFANCTPYKTGEEWAKATTYLVRARYAQCDPTLK